MSAAKRKAPNDTVAPSSFEHELKRIDQSHGLRKCFLILICFTLSFFVGKSKEAWKRPELAPLSPREEALSTKTHILIIININVLLLEFLQIEIDHGQDRPHECVRFDSKGSPIPVFRLFGVTADQHSVTCHVHGFLPYFYVSCPNSINLENLSDFHKRLEHRLRDSDSSPMPLFKTEIVHRTNLYGFVAKHVDERYIRITCTSPNAMNAAKRKLFISLPSTNHLCRHRGNRVFLF